MRAADDEQERAQRLAAALATYADPLENPAPRLLAARAIDQARVVRPQRWKWLAVAGLVSAMAWLLLIAFVASLDHELARPSIAVSPHSSHKQKPQLAQVHSTPSPAVFTHVAAHLTTRTRPPELPRLDQFPTPQPLTEQERLMLAFVSTATPATQQLVARAVEPPVPILDAELTGSSSPESTSPENTGAPHEEHR